MSDEKRQILDMLAEKKITVDEAEKLLEALGSGPRQKSDAETGANNSDSAVMMKVSPKFLKILVAPKNDKGDSVKIKIPLFLIKAGVKLGSIIPGEAREKINKAMGEKGFDFDLNKLDSKSLDEMLKALQEFSIDVDDEDETVKIYCE
ncbi:MAG: DUF2089 domain-containing protein [FCB group bacterium]|nr:DUF2089 domain-containing protein [FCB group bacterium]